MACYVRLMRKEDVAQVTWIERESFPDQWSPPDYQRELKNRLAHYLVACDEWEKIDESEVKAIPQKGFSRLVSSVKQLLNHNRVLSNELASLSRQYIIGFAGFWAMADEAHITSIAVRKQHRRQGVGELLLIHLIELAIELKARIITLEVRASNTVAQRLYDKYGFTQVDLRRGYYIDNREDAVLMTAENINSVSFLAHLQRLKQAHAIKWGLAPSRVVH